MKKVLFAINNQPAENKLSKLIKEKSTEEFQIVGTLVTNESIEDFLMKKPADILVYTEGLNGKDDGFDYILRIHRRYPNLRIVFIAGQRTIGDKKLATLVAFHIYDIIAGKRILMQDVADKIVTPSKFEDVVMYLPDGNDLFKETDFLPHNSMQVQNAQRETDQIVERATFQKQLAEAEQNNRNLSWQLSAAQSRVRDLETEQANWREEISKEKMFMEKSFDADKKALSAKIIELTETLASIDAERKSAQKAYNDLQEKFNEQQRNLSAQQNQSGTALKAVQNDLRVAHVQLEEKTAECQRLQNELDRLKSTIERDTELAVKDAKAQAEKLLNEAKRREEEAAKLTAELQRKLQLYGDDGFEAYKTAELEKLEAEKKKTQDYVKEQLDNIHVTIDKEYQAAQLEKAKRLREMDDLIATREEEISHIDERIKKAESEVREAKQKEIVRMDAAIEQKRREVGNIDEIIAKEFEDKRAAKVKEIEALDGTIFNKTLSLKSLSEDITRGQEALAKLSTDFEATKTQHEAERLELQQKITEEAEARRLELFANADKAAEEQRAKVDESAAEYERLVNKKKRQLAKELGNYEQELVAKKIAMENEHKIDYVYHEEDFDAPASSLAKKCMAVMCYSATPGAGNSTMALNVATYLATLGHKTIYVELSATHPTLKDNLGISIIKDNLSNCFDGMKQRKYETIDQNIITKQKIVNVKASALEMHIRYPDMLNFLTFTEDGKYFKVNSDLVKGLHAYLSKKKRYEYIIFDVPANTDIEVLNTIYSVCGKHVFDIPQDILAMTDFTRFRSMLKTTAVVDQAYYVINKYAENSILSNRKIAEICSIRTPSIIPYVLNEMILASYKSIPAILVSKTRELVAAYKAIGDYILK